MQAEKLAQQLHEHEKKILKALGKKKSITINELEKKTGLPKDALEKASLWAKVKGVVKISEKIIKFLVLTDEGREYAKKDLPERNLLNRIKKGENKITDLQKEMDRFQIGLVWVKKNNWVKIKEGKLELTKNGKLALKKKIPEEIVLKDLLSKRKPLVDFDIEIVNKLEKRGLIKTVVERKKEISLTDLGRKILPKLRVVGGIGQLTPAILKSGEWKTKGLREYNINLPSSKIFSGKRHYMMQVMEYIRQIWLEMGFKEMTGPMVEVSFWNFDGLYQPQDHPARDLADTFYMKIPEKGKLPEKGIVDAVKSTHEHGWTCNSTGWQYKWDEEFARRCVLRTHTTSLSARTLATLRKDVDNLPAKYFSVGRCFRNETLDWKHLAEFHQTEGIVVDENVTFKHLLGYLREFFTKLGFEKARFRPSYFPYTEESTEVEVWHPEHKNWVELGGSGIFRPEVVKPLLGKDIPVLAWGLAVERLVMLNYEIEDIRELYWNDLKKLREAKIWLV